MELSDYDVLGISEETTFKMVKHAYHELSRIYHPDTSQSKYGETSEERLIAFIKIKTAYENIKEKLNIVEVDLPHEEINYLDPKFDKLNIKINNKLNLVNNKEEFNKIFNKEFEKEFENENKDNPFSLYYEIPKEKERNLPESKIILKDFKKVSNILEFGINYIEDHSCEKFFDIRYNDNCTSKNLKTEKINPINSDALDTKLEEMLNIREKEICMLEEELNLISQHKHIQKEIEFSKRKVINNRNKKYLN